MRINRLNEGFENLTKEKARLIGHLIGDGCVYKTKTNYYLRYEVTDLDLLEQFENDLSIVYGTPIKKGVHESGKKKGKFIPFAYTRSKLAFNDLKKYCKFSSTKWFVPRQIFETNKEIKREFLRALFDDEGSVIPPKDLCVRLYSINKTGLQQIQKILEEFEIKSKLREGYGSKRNVYAIVVKEVKQFHNTIGFSCRRKTARIMEFI